MSYQARLRAYNSKNHELRVNAIVNLAWFTRLTITGFLHCNPINEKSVALCISCMINFSKQKKKNYASEVEIYIRTLRTPLTNIHKI
jgi:hypothetical protein